MLDQGGSGHMTAKSQKAGHHSFFSPFSEDQSITWSINYMTFPKRQYTAELQNVKSFTRSKSVKPNFTPSVNRDKFSTKGYIWGISYDPGLKIEFHISCTNLPKTILDLQNVCILADFLPQPSNFWTRIYLPYLLHFATLIRTIQISFTLRLFNCLLYLCCMKSLCKYLKLYT